MTITLPVYLQMKHKYVFEHNMGLAVHAATNKPRGIIRRFESTAAAHRFVEEFRAPNHCPNAFSEIVTRRSIESLLPRQNAFGDWTDHWIGDEDGSDYCAV